MIHVFIFLNVPVLKRIIKNENEERSLVNLRFGTVFHASVTSKNYFNHRDYWMIIITLLPMSFLSLCINIPIYFQWYYKSEQGITKVPMLLQVWTEYDKRSNSHIFPDQEWQKVPWFTSLIGYNKRSNCFFFKFWTGNDKSPCGF